MTVPRNNASPVCVYEFSDTFTLGGITYLRDYGPYGLHAAFPGGGANPTKQLDGSHSFDGGDYLTLPLAYYQYAPVAQHTWITWVGYPVGTGTLFSCWNGGGGGANNRGTRYALGAAPTVSAYVGTGGAAFNQNNAGTSYYAGRHGVMLHTVEATCRAVRETLFVTTAWGVGAYGNPVYDATVPPWIGQTFGPANQYTGRIYYLAQLPYAATNEELLWFVSELREGRKPYTARA